MAIPLPANCQFNAERGGVTFQVEIDGQVIYAFITTQTLVEHLNAGDKPEDLEDRVRTSSLFTQKVRELVSDGVDKKEEVFLNRGLFRPR
jgi:hypothetical protein